MTLLIAVCTISTVIQAFSQKIPVKNIVPVHGAWAHGSGWKGVYDILLKDHFNVSIVQEPETFLKGDVAAVKRVPAEQAAFMARSQVFNVADNFSAIITAAAWRTKPTWVLVAGRDRTINPELERWYASRAKSHMVEVPGASQAVYYPPSAESCQPHPGSCTRCALQSR